MDSFVEKTFLITGGAQGIGRGIAEYLLVRGAQVVIADRDDEAGQQFVVDGGMTRRMQYID